MSDLADLERRAQEELAACRDETALRTWHHKFVGNQGEFSQALKRVGEIPKEQRREYGQEANRIKEELTRAYEEALAREKDRDLERSLTANPLDVTLPGRTAPLGRLHVATKMLREIYAIFADLGFQIYRSRAVEDDLPNFELL